MLERGKSLLLQIRDRIRIYSEKYTKKGGRQKPKAHRQLQSSEKSMKKMKNYRVLLKDTPSRGQESQ